MTSYIITVTEAELDVVRLALGRMLEPRKVAERKSAPVEMFNPNTGDDRLDAFMRDARRRVGAPKPRKATAPSKLPSKMTAAERLTLQRFNETAVGAWRALGHEVIVTRVEGARHDDDVALDGRNVRVLPLGVTA